MLDHCVFLVLLSGLAYQIVSGRELCDRSPLTVQGVGSHGNLTSRLYPDYETGNQPGLCQTTLETTCMQCRLVLEFEDLSFPVMYGGLQSGGRCSPGYDYIYLVEPDFPFTTTRFYHGGNITGASKPAYTTLSRNVHIVQCQSGRSDLQLRFRISYHVERKLEVLAGALSGHVTSPNFPSGYPLRGEVYTYELQNLDPRGYIRLWFDDWNLSNHSAVSIQLSDMALPYRYSGADPRPFLVSRGPKITLTFETGIDSSSHDLILRSNPVLDYVGFRASFNFTDQREWWEKPQSYSCGEYYRNTWGGKIEFDTGRCHYDEIVDCIWVIRKFRLQNYNRYIWLRISDLRLDRGESLEVRSGNHSQGQLLNDIYQVSHSEEFEDEDGFYVRLRARCRADRKFEAVYTSYAQAEKMYSHDSISWTCKSLSHMLCDNHRCIWRHLRCDNVNHCGDWSDEHDCDYDGNKPQVCQTKFPCGTQGGGFYCLHQKCDNVYDCRDGADEMGCFHYQHTTPVSNHPPTPDHSQAFYWGVITPIILISVILAIIACVVISYYMRRKQRSRRHNARNNTAGQQQTLMSHNYAYPAALEPLPPVTYDMSPPSYEESVQVINTGHGALNVGYRSDSMDLPPPYSVKDDDAVPKPYLTPLGHGVTTPASLPGVDPTLGSDTATVTRDNPLTVAQVQAVLYSTRANANPDSDPGNLAATPDNVRDKSSVTSGETSPVIGHRRRSNSYNVANPSLSERITDCCAPVTTDSDNITGDNITRNVEDVGSDRSEATCGQDVVPDIDPNTSGAGGGVVTLETSDSVFV